MIKMNSIAIQLYSAREELARDFSGTMRKIAGYGYTAVELARFPASVTPEGAKSLMDDLGMTIIGTHSPLPMGVDKHAVLDNILPLETPYVVCPMLDEDNYFQDLDGIKAACEMLNEANSVVKENGMQLAYHNHWFEMQPVDGKPAYQHMLEYLEEDIAFELDTYWAKVAGLDPLQVMADLKGRLPLLHIKDGPAEDNIEAMVALGDGAMDIPSLLEASDSTWHIVEIDRTNDDMLAAIKQSYNYLMEFTS